MSGLDYLIHGAHVVALRQARIIVDRDQQDAPGYMFSNASVFPGYARRASREPDHFVTNLSILSRVPLQRHVNSRHEAELLAHYQVHRVFSDHRYGVEMNAQSLTWAEDLMIQATRHFERVGRFRTR